MNQVPNNFHKNKAKTYLSQAALHLGALGREEAAALVDEAIGDIVPADRPFIVPNPPKPFRWQSPQAVWFTVLPLPGNRQGVVYWQVRKYKGGKLHVKYVGKNLTEAKLIQKTKLIEAKL